MAINETEPSTICNWINNASHNVLRLLEVVGAKEKRVAPTPAETHWSNELDDNNGPGDRALNKVAINFT